MCTTRSDFRAICGRRPDYFANPAFERDCAKARSPSIERSAILKKVRMLRSSNWRLALAMFLAAGCDFASADVIYSGFGANNSYYALGSRSATTPPRGNPAADADLAQALHVYGAPDFALTSIHLAVRLAAGANRLDVWLMGNQQQPGQQFGKPDGTTLESFRVEGQMTSASRGSVIHLASALRPVLHSGWDYWVVLSVPDPGSDVQWYSASLDLPPAQQWIGERFSFNQNQWEIAHAFSGFAVRLEGAQIPTPSTGSLSLAACLAVLAVSARAHRRMAKPISLHTTHFACLPNFLRVP